MGEWVPLTDDPDVNVMYQAVPGYKIFQKGQGKVFYKTTTQAEVGVMQDLQRKGVNVVYHVRLFSDRFKAFIDAMSGTRCVMPWAVP